jgi:hypothetical protein
LEDELCIVELELLDLHRVILVDEDVDCHVQVLQGACEVPINLVLLIIFFLMALVVESAKTTWARVDAQLVDSHFGDLRQDLGIF